MVLLFATMAFHAFFGVSLTTSQVLLAPRWYGLMGRDWGADAITDQQYGGAFAWGLGEIPVLISGDRGAGGVATADARTAKRLDGRRCAQARPISNAVQLDARAACRDPTRTPAS